MSSVPSEKRMKWSTSNLPNRLTGAPKSPRRVMSEVEENASHAISLTPKAAFPLPDPMGFRSENNSPTVYSPAMSIGNWSPIVGDEFESEKRLVPIKHPRILTENDKKRRANVHARMEQNTLNVVAAGIQTPTRSTRPYGINKTPYGQQIAKRNTRSRRRQTRRRGSRRQHKTRQHT